MKLLMKKIPKARKQKARNAMLQVLRVIIISNQDLYIHQSDLLKERERERYFNIGTNQSST